MKNKIEGVNFIGFEASKLGNQTFQTFSCRQQISNEEIFTQITSKELANTIEKAARSYGVYRQIPIQIRIDFLVEITKLLDENRSELVVQYCKESSLTSERGNTELSRTITQLNTYIDYISKKDWEIISSEDYNGQFFQKKWTSLGPIVVFGASNFPFAYSTIGGDTASALAAGNPVIYKANPFHAGLSELVAKIILNAAKIHGIPDGVFSLVQGNEHWIGEQLLKDERVKAVGFTGSIKGGEALLDYAKTRKKPIPVFCEMGSLNPVFIFDDLSNSQLVDATQKLVDAVMTDGGQFCTKPGLIFITRTQFDKVQSVWEKLFAESKPFPLVHKSIFESYSKHINSRVDYFNIASEQSIEGFASPTLMLVNQQEFIKDKQLQEEVFGPYTLLIICENELVFDDCVDQLDGQLTASFWSNKMPEQIFMDKLIERAGRIIQNGVSTGVAVIDSMQHGGGYPASSDARFSAVGKDAIYRFMKPVSLQNFG